MFAAIAFWTMFDWALESFRYREISDRFDGSTQTALDVPPAVELRVQTLDGGAWRIDERVTKTPVALSAALAARRGDGPGLRIADLVDDEQSNPAALEITTRLCTDAGFVTRRSGFIDWPTSVSDARTVGVARASEWTRHDAWFSSENPEFEPWVDELTHRYALGPEIAAQSMESIRRLALHTTWTTFARRLHPEEADVLDLWMVAGELPSELPDTETGRAWSLVRREFLALMDADRQFLIEGMQPLDQKVPAFLPSETGPPIPDDSPTLSVSRDADGKLAWRLGELKVRSTGALIQLLSRSGVRAVFLEFRESITYGDAAVTIDACKRSGVDTDFREMRFRDLTDTQDTQPPEDERSVIEIAEDGLMIYKGQIVYDPTEESLPRPTDPKGIVNLLVGWQEPKPGIVDRPVSISGHTENAAELDQVTNQPPAPPSPAARLQSTLRDLSCFF